MHPCCFSAAISVNYSYKNAEISHFNMLAYFSLPFYGFLPYIFWCFVVGCKTLKRVTCFSVFPQNKVQLHSSGWPQICYVVQVIWMYDTLLFPQCWDYKYAASWLATVTFSWRNDHGLNFFISDNIPCSEDYMLRWLVSHGNFLHSFISI
jgi:hypothetical protein